MVATGAGSMTRTSDSMSGGAVCPRSYHGPSRLLSSPVPWPASIVLKSGWGDRMIGRSCHMLDTVPS